LGFVFLLLIAEQYLFLFLFTVNSEKKVIFFEQLIIFQQTVILTLQSTYKNQVHKTIKRSLNFAWATIFFIV